jgi:pilus assembly protein CpaC
MTATVPSMEQEDLTMYAKSRVRVRHLMTLTALLATLVAGVTPADAARERLRIPVGRSIIVTSTEDVRTVAIAEPKIADAAVGSARTVVVNAMSPGVTSLVVYNEGGRFTVYDVESYIPNSDVQVVLRARVAEMNDNARKELGFDWTGNVTSNAIGGTLVGGLFTAKVADPGLPLGLSPNTDGALKFQSNTGWSLATIWKALEQSGDLRTLADPTLVARSGEAAEFQAGGEFPVPISSGGANGQTTVTIEWREFGVLVSCTPTVLEDSTISLKVTTEVSALDNSNPLVLTGFVVPSLITRKASTTVEMKRGEYLAIGGLKTHNTLRVVNRVPIFGHIPIFGFFFTSTRTENVTSELLVLVQPDFATPSAGLLPVGPAAGNEQ